MVAAIERGKVHVTLHVVEIERPLQVLLGLFQPAEVERDRAHGPISDHGVGGVLRADRLLQQFLSHLLRQRVFERTR